MYNQPLDPSDRTIVKRLRKMRVFSSLDDLQLDQIVNLAKLCKYGPGEEVIAQGATDQILYFLISGELVIFKQQVEIGRITRLGEVFGEMGLIDGNPRSATIRAVKPTLCLALEAAFLSRLEGHSKTKAEAVFYKGFSEVLTLRLRDSLDRVLELETRLAAKTRNPQSVQRSVIPKY